MTTLAEFDHAPMQELAGYEARLKEAPRPVKHRRRLAHDRVRAASARGVVDVEAAVDSAFTEVATDGELADIRAGQYIVKEMLACAHAGVLDSRDSELRHLRRLIRRLHR